MAVVLPNGTLARLALDGGVPREIADHVAEADWAPDGNLAIIRDSGRRRIEFPPGHVLYESGGRISGLRVSPRNDRVAFVEIGSTQHRVSNIATEGAGSVVMMDRQGPPDGPVYGLDIH